MKLKQLLNKIPHHLLVAALLTIVNLLVLAIRNWQVGNSIFDFLKSNLFSGFIPLMVAVCIEYWHRRMNTVVFWFVSFVWLLFYPNSPYMISDLIHNSNDDRPTSNLVIFETLIIFSIAMLSIYYGVLSLRIMHYVFKQRYSAKIANSIIVITLLVSCPGFYIGRVVPAGTHTGNLYSWDLFLHPIKTIDLIYSYFWPISTHQDAYWMMALFGVIQGTLLVMMKDVSEADLAI